MMYVTVVNKGNHAYRFFADSVDEALEMAMALKCARKVENLTVTQHYEICSECFPHKGWASCSVPVLKFNEAALAAGDFKAWLGEPEGKRIWHASLGGVSNDQHAEHLHPVGQCDIAGTLTL